MTDHDELAEQQEEEADRLERESELVAEAGDDARAAVDSSHSEASMPAPLGESDPGYVEAPEGEGDSGAGGEQDVPADRDDDSSDEDDSPQGET